MVGAEERGGTAELRGQRRESSEQQRGEVESSRWGSLALAFSAGLTCALIGARRRDGRRSFAAEVLRSTMRRLPAALATGVRDGVGDALRREWRRQPDGRGEPPRAAA